MPLHLQHSSLSQVGEDVLFFVVVILLRVSERPGLDAGLLCKFHVTQPKPSP
jgi:hypothetical protein